MYHEDFLVYEVKGLLEGLDDSVDRLRFNLSSDNVHSLLEDLPKIKAIVNRIEFILTESKSERINNNNNDDDLY